MISLKNIVDGQNIEKCSGKSCIVKVIFVLLILLLTAPLVNAANVSIIGKQTYIDGVQTFPIGSISICHYEHDTDVPWNKATSSNESCSESLNSNKNITFSIETYNYVDGGFDTHRNATFQNFSNEGNDQLYDMRMSIASSASTAEARASDSMGIFAYSEPSFSLYNTLLNYYNWIKANEPTHAVYTYHGRAMEDRINVSDVLGFYMYYHDDGQYWDDTEVSMFQQEHFLYNNFIQFNCTLCYDSLKEYDKPVWLVVEGHGLDWYEGGWYGTLHAHDSKKEVRAATYYSITAGASGIVYWGYKYYGDGSVTFGTKRNDTINAWYDEIAGEMKNMNDILVLPNVNESWGIYTTDNKVTFSNNPTLDLSDYASYANPEGDRPFLTYALKHNTSTDKYYLFVVNRNVSESVTTDITLSGFNSSWDVATIGNFYEGNNTPGRTFEMNTTGSFTDTFDGYGVHIYELSSSESGGATNATVFYVNSTNWNLFDMNNVSENQGSHGINVGTFADNFSDGDSVGWYESGGTWSASTQKYIQSGNAATFYSARSTIPNLTRNFGLQAEFNLTILDSAPNKLGFIILNHTNQTYPQQVNYLYMVYNHSGSTLQLGRYLNGSQTDNISHVLVPSMSLNTTYTFKLFYNSSNWIHAKIWNKTTVEPAWQFITQNDNFMNGTPGISFRRTRFEIDDFRVYNHYDSGQVTSGNLTTYYNWLDGNVTYQLVINTTTPENTNYTVHYRTNGTGAFTQVGGNYTSNQTISLSPAYQNTDVRIVLNGNNTNTPELISIAYYAQAPSVHAPNITSWSNNQTNDQSLSISAVTGQSIRFNATANQTVEYWNWSKT